LILLLLSALLRDRADDERCPIEGDGEIERGDRNDSRKDDDEPPPKADDETSPPATGSLARALLEIGTEDDDEETHERGNAPDIAWIYVLLKKEVHEAADSQNQQ